MFDLTPPINPPNHPSNHQTTHPLMDGEFFTDFKSSNELKYLDKLKCYRILSDSRGPPPWGGGRWVDGGGGWHGCVWGVSCMHTCTHMHTHTHMHVKHAKHGCLHVGGHLQFLYMYKCVCVHVCACACMCVCVGTAPHAPRCPPPTCPLPRATGSPKHQNSISPELIEIIQFCLKILYL